MTTLQGALDLVQSRAGATPVDAAIVLGSGLGGLARQVEEAVKVPYGDLPGFSMPGVAGHEGALIVGTLGGRRVVALAGRLHMYEGHSAAAAAFPVRVARALGAPVLLLSNAAGGVRRNWEPGQLMLVRDHVNLAFRNPLLGAVEPGDARFPDMSMPYDDGLAALFHAEALVQGTRLEDGVYGALTGPSYETPTEIRMLERIGVDAVGMSTVPETIVANALGMRVAAVSCITNPAAGLALAPISHAEVIDVTREAAGRFERLVVGVLARLR